MLFYRKLLQQAAGLTVLTVGLVPRQHPRQVEAGEAHRICVSQTLEAIQKLGAVGIVVEVVRVLQPIAHQRQHPLLHFAGGHRLRLLDGGQRLLPMAQLLVADGQFVQVQKAGAGVKKSKPCVK